MDKICNIPHIIHYCWFGKNKKGKEIENYISTWKKYFPDFEIVEWNETNFDINKYSFAQQAYAKGKYAFVSDVARICALEEYGGIYLDTDVEILKPFSNLLNDKMILAHESYNDLMTAFIAAVPHHQVLQEMLEKYRNIEFIENGKMNMTPNTVYLTELVKKRGLILNNAFQKLNDDITVYPNDIIGGFDVVNSHFILGEDTVLVHNFKASWQSSEEKRTLRMKMIISKLLGKNLYSKLRLFKKKIKSS